MTGNEIFDIARKKMPQPDGMTLSELMLFTIARNICKALSDGVIDREQAHREKDGTVFVSVTGAQDRIFVKVRRCENE